MPKRYRLELSEEERTQLEHWVKNPPRPYLRYRARAILQVASGLPISQVALSLRLRVHRTAVSEWVRRFEKDRIEGLKIQPGRGRKPHFSPSANLNGPPGD
jgi:biotin operon repressor